MLIFQSLTPLFNFSTVESEVIVYQNEKVWLRSTYMELNVSAHWDFSIKKFLHTTTGSANILSLFLH